MILKMYAFFFWAHFLKPQMNLILVRKTNIFKTIFYESTIFVIFFFPVVLLLYITMCCFYILCNGHKYFSFISFCNKSTRVSNVHYYKHLKYCILCLNMTLLDEVVFKSNSHSSSWENHVLYVCTYICLSVTLHCQ